MTKEFLTKLGVADELIAQIVAESLKETNAIQDKLNTATQELKDANEKIRNAEKDKAAAVKEVQDKLDAADKDKQAALDGLKLDFSLNQGLEKANVHSIKAIMPYIDKSKLKIEDDKLTGLDEQIKAIKESDPYLFKPDEPTEPKPQFSTMLGSGGGDPDDAAVRAIMGLPPTA